MPRGHLPALLEESFASGRCLPVLLLRIDIPEPAAPICLLYGSGELTLPIGLFSGTDDRFGSLAALTPPEDGLGNQAPNMQFSINCPSDTASAVLASSTYQGSRVRLWVGGLQPFETGPVAAGTWLGEYLLFDGFLDRPILSVDKGERELEFECASGFEELFSDNEGQRLAEASHLEVWPGERGFRYVTGVQRSVIWGPGERPGGGPIYPSSGGGYGGGFGGGGGRFDRYNIREF